MEAALCLLDSFGTAKTYLCNAASRFSLRVTLEYDMADLLIGASLQVPIYQTKILNLGGMRLFSSGPVHTYTFTSVNAYILIRLHLASTRKRRFKLS